MIAAWRRRFTTLPLPFAPLRTARRNDIRLKIRAAVTVRADSYQVDCHTINVSASGVLVDRPLPVKRGAAVEVSADGVPRPVRGRVVRIGANSTAIEIVSGSMGLVLLGGLTAQVQQQTRTEPRPYGTASSV